MMKLYTGDYLQEYDYWWAEGERQRLKELWLSVSLSMAEWYVDQERIDEAILCYFSIQRHPLEEKAYFSLMKIYAVQDNPAQVHRLFSLLCQVLEDEMGEEKPLHCEMVRRMEQWNSSRQYEIDEIAKDAFEMKSPVVRPVIFCIFLPDFMVSPVLFRNCRGRSPIL